MKSPNTTFGSRLISYKLKDTCNRYARIFSVCTVLHFQTYKTGRFGDRTHTQTYVVLRCTMSPNTMFGSRLICYSTKDLQKRREKERERESDITSFVN